MWTGIILGLLIVALEAAASSQPVQQRVPFQAYGTNHIQFELQLNDLHNFVQKNGAPDCFILGNSQSLRSVDPQVFNQAYQDQTGKNIRCYNFSVVGANISTTYLFSKILIQQYHPRLLILGTSFLDYTESRENRNDPRFEENAWLDYQLGKASLKGWLIDHSYAFRLLQLISYGAPEHLDYTSVNKEIRMWKNQLTAYGYGRSSEVMDLSQPAPGSFAKNFIELFGKFGTSDWNITSLEDILRLGDDKNIQTLIVEMPYDVSLMDFRDANDRPLPEDAKIKQFVLQINAQIQEIADRYHTPFWQTSQLEIFPADGWHDRYHLNKNGSPVFSQWLAEQMATAVADGQMKDPTAAK